MDFYCDTSLAGQSGRTSLAAQGGIRVSNRLDVLDGGLCYFPSCYCIIKTDFVEIPQGYYQINDNERMIPYQNIYH